MLCYRWVVSLSLNVVYQVVVSLSLSVVLEVGYFPEFECYVTGGLFS